MKQDLFIFFCFVFLMLWVCGLCSEPFFVLSCLFFGTRQ